MMGRYYDVRLTEGQIKGLINMGRYCLGGDVNPDSPAALDWLEGQRASEVEAARRAVDRLVEAQAHQ
jgi:hypothetical protein